MGNTHLWCVLRTQGKAEAMEMAITTVVRIPIVNTAGCAALYSSKRMTILRIIHMKPEIAQPE